ncbi:hypothetical protein MMC06_002335 [Schaereria dolodes]|nr:hypothetical protein [Schaereria dolodes]
MSHTAAVLRELKKPLVIEQRAIPTPGVHEVLVRNYALATNPVDWKVQQSGHFNQPPTILGSDICGTVEAVGPDVTRFKKDDRVTGFAAVIANHKMDHGAFQEYTLLMDNCVAKIPKSISYEEGAILPMSVATAAGGIYTNLEIPRLGVQQQSGGFLVWGGSSSVGSAAVQIATLLGFTVYATASPANHEYVKKLGAKAVFDYKDSHVVESMIAAAKKEGLEIRYAFDAIAEHGSSPKTASIVSAFGWGKMCATLPWPADSPKVENVMGSSTAAFRICTDQQGFGRWLFNDWLQGALADGSFVPSPSIEKVEGGLGSVQKALDMHMKGISGKKLVLPLA